MRYQKFPPSEPLRPFVECYFIWEGAAPERLDVQTPPSGKGAIVINYGDPTWAWQHESQLVDVPDNFVCGQFLTNFHRMLHGNIGMAGIVFKPTGIHNFFGTRMSNLVNTRMPLKMLIGDTHVALVENVKNSNQDADRVAHLEAFLLAYLPAATQRLTIIDDVVDYIDSKKGVSTVEEVATHFGISKRYLEKRFLEKVGISPKLYSRLRRFVLLSLELAYHNNSDWQDLVAKAGLHDQSHLIKEFMQFNHMNPTEYFKNHREMPRFVK